MSKLQWKAKQTQHLVNGEKRIKEACRRGIFELTNLMPMNKVTFRITSPFLEVTG